MIKLQLVAFLFCSASIYGQHGTRIYSRVDVEIIKTEEKASAKVEIKSPFPGGDSSWIRSVEDKLNQSSKLAKGAKKGRYIVSVQFVVDKDTAINDVKALTSNGYAMESEVVVAIRTKGPQWLPSSRGVLIHPYRKSSSSVPKTGD